MTRFVLKGILSRKLRTALTALAILLGVAMISGTFVLTDQITGAFNDIFQKGNRGINAVVSPKKSFTSDNGGATLALPDSLIAKIRGVDGVDRVEGTVGTIGYSIVKDGKYRGSTSGAPALAYSVSGDVGNSTTIVSGAYPKAHGEVAVDKGLADSAKLKVGDSVGMTTAAGVKPVRIAGVFKYAASVGGATIVLTTLPDAQEWFDSRGKVSQISVKTKTGVSDAEIVRRIQPVLTSGAEVKTGAQSAIDQAKEINDSIGGFLTPALLAFAGVAVLVGAFIIFNTFSITVAQRIREFAMLRTLGAGRNQVLRAVIGEALVVAVIASVLGIIAGFAIAAGILALFDAIGFGLPTTSPSLNVRSVGIGLAVGIGVTLLASVGPALRATRIPPIAALREGATLPPGRLHRFTPYIAALAAVAGVLLLAAGFTSSGSVSNRLLGMAFGAVLIFIAVAMTAKYVVAPIARTVGWPLERLFSATGRIARENSMRNPARTAVTSSALMIGLGLVVFVAVFAQGLKDSFLGALDKSVQGDLIIQSQGGGQPVPGGTLAAAQGAAGVGTASGLRDLSVRVNGTGNETATGVSPDTFLKVYKMDWRNGGTDALIGKLGSDGALVEKDLLKSRKLKVGDRIAVESEGGRKAEWRILGSYRDPQLLSGFLVSDAAVNRLTDDRGFGVLIVKAKPGVSTKQVEASVTEAAKQYPVAKVQSNADYRKSVSDQLNQLLSLLYALLGMSVVISLFGMVNTLVLSIFERTREIGMLRAIGVTRRQLRRMVRYESVITAVIGGLLGIAVGLFFGWVMAKGLESEGILFSVPYGQLVVFLVMAVIAGILAAILPARRAARLNPLEALHYE